MARKNIDGKVSGSKPPPCGLCNIARILSALVQMKNTLLMCVWERDWSICPGCISYTLYGILGNPPILRSSWEIRGVRDGRNALGLPRQVHPLDSVELCSLFQSFVIRFCAGSNMAERALIKWKERDLWVWQQAYSALSPYSVQRCMLNEEACVPTPCWGTPCVLAPFSTPQSTLCLGDGSPRYNALWCIPRVIRKAPVHIGPLNPSYQYFFWLLQ